MGEVDINYYDHVAYVHPLAINLARGIVTQFYPDGTIERQVILSTRGASLLVAFLESPGQFLSRNEVLESDEALRAVGASLEVVQAMLSKLNVLLAQLNLAVSAVKDTGYILMAKSRKEIEPHGNE